jgi:hypothetical protein
MVLFPVKSDRKAVTFAKTLSRPCAMLEDLSLPNPYLPALCCQVDSDLQNIQMKTVMGKTIMT